MIRKEYRAALACDDDALTHAICCDHEIVQTAIQNGRCLTVALYRHEDMLFLYCEFLDAALTPNVLFPALTNLLALWPERSGKSAWVWMVPIFYHAVPQSEAQWARPPHKARRGRIAYLLPDKLFSYVTYHKKLVDEGLLDGDQYQFISLHEDILFSYFEEPKIMTHLSADSDMPSAVIEEWLKIDPESHFDHTLSGADNFLLLNPLFTMGKEDLPCVP